MAIGFAVLPTTHAQAPKIEKPHSFAHLAPKDYAWTLVAKTWQKRSEWTCLARLWGKESAWNHKAQNPTSTAFGIPQFLQKTWETYGFDTPPKSPHTQIDAGLRYITSRYKTPCIAWKVWQMRGWY